MGNVGSFYGNLAVIGNGVSGGYYNGYRSKVINAVPKISGNFKVKVNTNVAPLSATLEVYNYNFNEVGSELDTSTVLTIPLLNVNFISDGVYEVLFQFENRQTEMLSTLHSSIPHLKFALQNIGKPSDVVSISGTLKITNIEQEILLGGRYWIIPNLPDIKQSDFIKAISAIIGTFPLFTESNGLVFVSLIQLCLIRRKRWIGPVGWLLHIKIINLMRLPILLMIFLKRIFIDGRRMIR